MNSRDTGCLGLAAALVLGALASDARADDAKTGSRVPSLERAARPAGAKPARAKPDVRLFANRAVPPGGPAVTPFPPPLPGSVDPVAAHATMHAAPSSEPDAKAGSRQERRLAPGETLSALELSQRLFTEQTPSELFNSVIVPAARGVTIAQIQPEGAPPVMLTVRPTKITRGGGLVAVGQF